MTFGGPLRARVTSVMPQSRRSALPVCRTALDRVARPCIPHGVLTYDQGRYDPCITARATVRRGGRHCDRVPRVHVEGPGRSGPSTHAGPDRHTSSRRARDCPSRFARRRPTLVGTLAGRDSSSIDIRVRRGDPPIHIPLAAVGATYTSLGPRSRARAATVGALRSGAVGLVSGLIMAAFVSSGDASGTGVVIGRTAFGAALGAGIGIVAPGERWRRVRMCESSASAPGR